MSQPVVAECARRLHALYQGVIHDFVMLNALRETHAADAAIRQAIAFLSEALAAS